MMHGFKISTDSHKVKNRLIYVTLILFVLFCAKIWVQGFTHVFYGLSLVSAGLVVTNKESIMNLVGCGIISWRGLFAEGDYIEIADNTGVVYELGFLYFKLLEGSTADMSRGSGRFLKIPNGFVINNVVKRLSLSKHVIERKISFLVPVSKDVLTIKTDIEAMLTATLVSEVGNSTNFKNKESNFVRSYLHHLPLVIMDFCLDKPDYVKFTISYHCNEQQRAQIEREVKSWILTHALQS